MLSEKELEEINEQLSEVEMDQSEKNHELNLEYRLENDLGKYDPDYEEVLKMNTDERTEYFERLDEFERAVAERDASIDNGEDYYGIAPEFHPEYHSEITNSLELIAKNLEHEKTLNNQHMATIIYDPNNNENSLITKSHINNKQNEMNIKSEYNSFSIENSNGYKIDLKNILDEQNFNKLKNAHKENEIESFMLNKNELSKLEKNNVLDLNNDLDKKIGINKENDLKNDPVYKVLNADKELMEKAMLYYQQSKVLDVLTKAKEQLENVNYAIDNGLSSEGTRELQLSLQNDVNHLETRSSVLNNKLDNSNVLGEINNKIEKTKEKTKEQNNENTNDTKSSKRKRSRTEELSL